MSSAQQALRTRRERLLERAEHERAELAGLIDRWEKPLLALDRGVAFVRALKSKPWLGLGVGAGMTALAISRPRSILGWVLGGRAVWQLLTRERNKLSP